MKFSAVLFDMDGVLVDSFSSWFYLFNDSLNHFGYKKISEKEFKEKVWGGPIEKDISLYFKNETKEQVANYYFSNFNRFLDHVKMNPDARETLIRLREQKLKIGLVTNTFSKVAKDVLTYFELLYLFDAVVCGDDVKNGKPEPDMMQRACEQIGVSPSQAILIGDTHNDIIAGRKAGCTVIGFGIDADKRIDKLDEIFSELK